jgi:hypothetical protein
MDLAEGRQSDNQAQCNEQDGKVLRLFHNKFGF